MTLQLKLGGRYRRRDGEVVEITRQTPLSSHPWRGEGYPSYTDEGYYINPKNPDAFDLIEEVADTLTKANNALDYVWLVIWDSSYSPTRTAVHQTEEAAKATGVEVKQAAGLLGVTVCVTITRQEVLG